MAKATVRTISPSIITMLNGMPIRVYPTQPNSVNVYHFDTVAFKGDDGQSCYDMAVAGGYTGTKEEFEALLANLNNLLKNGCACPDSTLSNQHVAYFGFSDVQRMDSGHLADLTVDPINLYASREWDANNPLKTPKYAHILLPEVVAIKVDRVGIKGGLLGVWSTGSLTINGIPYTDFYSPYAFVDGTLTFVTK